MQLLYLDESGSVNDRTQQHFVLAGIALNERKTHWIEQQLNQIAARFNNLNPYDIELHASPMRGGRGFWRSIKPNARTAAVIDALKVAIESQTGIRVFGVVIKKSSVPGQDPLEMAFEQLSNRFDLFLKREYAQKQVAERGLILFDKNSAEQRIQTLARDFKYSGHSWGKTKNYAEVPVFLDSKASRLIQLADLVAWALFRKFERNDPTFFDLIKGRIDSEGGVQHGLYIRQ